MCINRNLDEVEQKAYEDCFLQAGAKYPVHIVNYDYERYIEEVKDLFQEISE